MSRERSAEMRESNLHFCASVTSNKRGIAVLAQRQASSTAFQTYLTACIIKISRLVGRRF